jgi:hypothetical protein
MLTSRRNTRKRNLTKFGMYSDTNMSNEINKSTVDDFEDGIILSNGYDNNTLLKIIGRLMILVEGQSQKLKMYSQTVQLELNSTYQSFSDRLIKVSHYDFLFELLELSRTKSSFNRR